MRVGPVAIANGAFGNRPHCIYRGFCLQGCKVNAKASPLVTHIPDAIEHGVEIRADCMVARSRSTTSRPRHRRALLPRRRSSASQRAAAVAVAGYSIETPRLLLNSTSARFPHGLGERQRPGRPLRDGAGRAAGRRPVPDELRMYKAPPPEICSEQFYETDPTRGFARGFAIQTVGPLPIDWAEHVLADGHWGAGAARVHARLQPLVHARRALASCCRCPRTASRSPRSTDRARHAGRADGLHPVRERPREHRLRQGDAAADPGGRRRAGHRSTIDRYAHLVGGCRMGSDPERSVVDADHRAWGVPNLFIADGSVMPTQGSANPALTIMALASRLAERLDLRRPSAREQRAPRQRSPRLPDPAHREPVTAEPSLRAAAVGDPVEDPVRPFVVL